MAYLAYFQSIIRYGIIFWGNANKSCKVFKLQKRVIRIMSGAEPTASCRGLFRKLEILLVPCQYILSLMLFIIVKSSPVTGLEWPRGFQEGKVPRFHDNGTGRW